MERRKLVLTGLLVGGAAVLAGGGYALAQDDGDDDVRFTRTVQEGAPSPTTETTDGTGGSATTVVVDLDAASAAALAHVGSGRVTGAELDDDRGPTRYEIEVTLDDGTEVDLDLDEQLVVLREEREAPDGDD